MAKNKLRLTVFSRFLLFIGIILPALYFGISHYKGEDGLKNLKEMIGLSTESSSDSETYSGSDNEVNSNVTKLEDALKNAERRIESLSDENESLEKENEDLKERIKNHERELQKFKAKLEKIFEKQN